jgi:hypothetical protein
LFSQNSTELSARLQQEINDSSRYDELLLNFRYFSHYFVDFLLFFSESKLEFHNNEELGAIKLTENPLKETQSVQPVDSSRSARMCFNQER